MAEDQGAELHPLSDAPSDLELVKSSWRKQAYEIVGGGRSFAYIDYTITGKATARSAEGTWTFSRPKGVIHRRIKVTSQDGQIRADLDLRAWKRGGMIELGGISYDIRAKGAVGERWRCERDGQELFTVKKIHSLKKGKGAIKLSALGRTDPNLALLLLLTMDANHASDSESAAAGAAAAAGA
jgi:hypothetical protein